MRFFSTSQIIFIVSTLSWQSAITIRHDTIFWVQVEVECFAINWRQLEVHHDLQMRGKIRRRKSLRITIDRDLYCRCLTIIKIYWVFCIQCCTDLHWSLARTQYPSVLVLLPVPNESINFASTQNIATFQVQIRRKSTICVGCAI